MSKCGMGGWAAGALASWAAPAGPAGAQLIKKISSETFVSYFSQSPYRSLHMSDSILVLNLSLSAGTYPIYPDL